jgi:hypothetical protein
MNYVLKYQLYIAPIDVPLYSLENSAYRVPDQCINDIGIGQNTSIDFTGGISLGVASPAEASINVIKNGLTSVTNRLFNWRLANVLIKYSVDNGSSYYTQFAGFIESRGEQMNMVSFRCFGYSKYLEYYKDVSPLWVDKPAATKIPDIPAASTPWSTTTSGVWGQYYARQDPTTLNGSFTGTINTVFWLLGGRPYKYRDHVKNQNLPVRFWYDCDPAPIMPKFTWLNKENVSNDMVQLAAAAGGQVTQDNQGVVRFVNPHSFVPSTNTQYTVTDSMFSQLTVDESSAVGYGKVIVTFSPRYLGANKVILDAPIGKYLPYNEEYEHEVEFQQPVDRITNNTYYGSGITFNQAGGYFGIDEYIKSKDFITAVDYNGDTAYVSLKVPSLSNLYFAKRRFYWTGNPSTSYWKYEKDVAKTAAQVFKVKVKNTDQARRLYLAKISLFGIPMVAGSQQTLKNDIPLEFSGLVTAGIIPSGFKEVSVSENPYVQSKDQAQRLIDVIKYLHKRPRPAVRISDLAYNPNVAIGDIILINSAAYGILNKKHKVVELQVNKTGATMNITCVDVSDIKTREDFFINGVDYPAETKKFLSW